MLGRGSWRAARNGATPTPSGPPCLSPAAVLASALPWSLAGSSFLTVSWRLTFEEARVRKQYNFLYLWENFLDCARECHLLTLKAVPAALLLD